jgi:hypothetical protein
MLSVLTKAGVYFALIRAHDVGHTEASIAVNRNAVPLAQRIALEEPASGDLNIRVAQGDDIAQAATSKGHARTASELAEKQDKARAQLVTQRQAIAERIAKLMEEQAGIKARKARTAAELGPALAIARLLGSGDVDGAIGIVCPLLVLAMDPLSLPLVVAASRRRAEPTPPPRPLAQGPKRAQSRLCAIAGASARAASVDRTGLHPGQRAWLGLRGSDATTHRRPRDVPLKLNMAMPSKRSHPATCAISRTTNTGGWPCFQSGGAFATDK